VHRRSTPATAACLATTAFGGSSLDACGPPIWIAKSVKLRADRCDRAGVIRQGLVGATGPAVSRTLEEEGSLSHGSHLEMPIRRRQRRDRMSFALPRFAVALNDRAPWALTV